MGELMSELLAQIGVGILVGLVFVGTIPSIASCWQYVLVGLHGFRNHLGSVENFTPRTSVVVPAWNEAAVIGDTVERLMDLEYPGESLRVYVVDDASDDGTGEILQAKQGMYPGRVFHLHRDQGGQGKSHTLNHGLDVILADDWSEAVLIIDADVILERDALRKMTRHLSDPEVGAVTAYIKEGSEKSNYLKRFIGFEYITAQAAGRRSQNVIGAMTCLAGGAQLHSRDSLGSIGGWIQTRILAEDTVTTLLTQLCGRRAVFEGNATVWAEEPGTIAGLWRQRLRWARGNIQVNKLFWRIWFNRRADTLGGISFGLFWFSTLFMPFFLIASSVSLLTLYSIDYQYSLEVFRLLWMIVVVSYVVVTSYTLLIDTAAARYCWKQGVLFPGIVSLLIIAGIWYPPLFGTYVPDLMKAAGVQETDTVREIAILFVYAWPMLSMLVAWLAKAVETRAGSRLLSPLFVYIAGYGALLCAISFNAFFKEAQGAEVKWEKTEKSGQVSIGSR